MLRFFVFSTLILTITRFCNGTEDFVGSAEDYNNERVRYIDLWELTKDSDIWNEADKKSGSLPVIPQEKLKELPENFIISDETLDLTHESLNVVPGHTLKKREVEPETPLEGSGDGGGQHPAEEVHHVQEEKPAAESESHKTGEDLFSLQSAVVVDENTPDAENGHIAENVDKNAEITSIAEEKPSENGVTNDKPIEDTVAEKTSEQPAHEDTVLTTEGDKKPEEATSPVTTTLATEEKQENDKPSDQSNPPEQEPESTKLPVETTHEQVETTESHPEIGIRVLSDNDPSKEHPEINVAAPEQENPSITGDKPIRKLGASNDQNPKEVDDSARVGETKEPTSKKDTKILLGLFGAVVGVGLIAVAYNYLRKKKNAQRAAVNGINKDDPEAGNELKPFIKTGENVNERQDKSEVKS